MRLLTLIRHAKSGWEPPSCSDFERRLDPRGELDAPLIAQIAAAELERPLLLMSSPAVRALVTAEIFAAALGLESTRIQPEPRIYEATAGDLLDVVQQLYSEHSHVVLFGHNPGFSDLARILLNDPLIDMPTCALLTLELNITNWWDTGPDTASVRRYHHP